MEEIPYFRETVLRIGIGHIPDMPNVREAVGQRGVREGVAGW